MSYKQDARYPLLTHKQQGFLDSFAINQDITQAVLENYDIKDPAQARSYGLTVIAHPSVAGLIRDHIQPKPVAKLPTSEELRAMYIDIYNNAEESRIKLQALTAYERVSGFSKPKTPVADQYDAINDIQG